MASATSFQTLHKKESVLPAQDEELDGRGQSCCSGADVVGIAYCPSNSGVYAIS